MDMLLVFTTCLSHKGGRIPSIYFLCLTSKLADFFPHSPICVQRRAGKLLILVCKLFLCDSTLELNSSLPVVKWTL